MNDQDKCLEVRSIQSSNCPRQEQKATLSTRLNSLQCLFTVFPSLLHKYKTKKKSVNILLWKINSYQSKTFELFRVICFLYSLLLRVFVVAFPFIKCTSVIQPQAARQQFHYVGRNKGHVCAINSTDEKKKCQRKLLGSVLLIQSPIKFPAQ